MRALNSSGRRGFGPQGRRQSSQFCGEGRRGFTLVEAMIVVGILGVISVPLVKFITSMARGVTVATAESTGGDRLRSAFGPLDRDFAEANQIDVSSATFIQFRMDSNRLPTYNPTADNDLDGLTNIKDPDDDNDIGTISAPSLAWRYGDDLRDDDDDNNSQIDLQCRYYLSSGTLIRDFNYNGAGWGQNMQVLAKNLMSSQFQFTYNGSKNQSLGRNIDLGNDGSPTTGDSGEGDNVIVPREIDWVQSPTGHGNRSGFIDTDSEKRYIVSVHVIMALDINGDGNPESRFETDYVPPLLVLKRGF